MAKDARAAKQQQRARDELDKGLKRGDAELAINALVALPREERLAVVGQVAPLFAELVQSARRAKRWSSLVEYAARADNEPALLTSLPENLRGEVQWSLMWGAAQSGQWEKAARWWKELQPAMGGRAAVLSAALDAWLVAHGAPPPESLTALRLESVAPAEDPRLGKESIKPTRRTVPAPQSAGEAERAVLTAAGSGWATFADNVGQWLGSDAQTAVAVATVAGPLCTRELLRRLASRSGRLAEPVVLLGRLVGVIPADASLAEESQVCFRALAAHVAGQHVSDPDLGRALMAAGEAALPSTPDLVRDAFLHILFTAEVIPGVLPFMERLFRQSRSPGVFAKTVRMWRLSSKDRGQVPTWLVSALQELLTEQKGCLAKGLHGVAKDDLHVVLSTVIHFFPAGVAEKLLDELWDHGDATLKGEVPTALQYLLERVADANLAPPGGWKSLEQRELFQEFMSWDVEEGEEVFAMEDLAEEAREMGLSFSQMNEVFALITDTMMGGHQSQTNTELWKRWQPRIGVSSRAFLAMSLGAARTDVQMEQVVRDYVKEHGGDFNAWMDVLEGTLESAFGPNAEPMIQMVLDSAGDDLGKLGKLYETLEKWDVPGPVIKRVAEAVVRVGQAKPPEPGTFPWRVLNVALNRFPSLRKKKEPAPKKPRATRKASKSASTAGGEAAAKPARRSTKPKAAGDKPAASSGRRKRGTQPEVGQP